MNAQTTPTRRSPQVRMPVATRRDEMLAGLDIGQARGIEVGALDKPLIERQHGPVYYVDHCSTDELKARWSSDSAVDVTRLHVDAVWGRASLNDALQEAGILRGGDDSMDYLLASHVVDNEIDGQSLQRMNSTQSAIDLARDAELNGTYHDVHCWVFTPRSWALLMQRLAELDLLNLRCEWMTGTAPYTYEFYAGLVPEADRSSRIDSWQQAVRLLDALPPASVGH